MENLSQSYKEFEDVWPSLLCAVVFLLLLLWDVHMAFKRRAHWAPGQALVLTALTIQMLSLISAMSDITLYVGSKQERCVGSNHKWSNDDRKKEVAQLIRKHQLLYDCGRLMMCVFLGYLLPAMVRSNWTNAWSDIGGLILTIMFRLAFEVYYVWRITDRKKIPDRSQSRWFAVSNTTLFTASLVLSLLLSCAVLAGKSIRSILSGKVQWALSCCSTSNSPYHGECKNPCCSTSDSREECKNSCCSDAGVSCKNWCCSQNPEKCESTEDHVLKCWIVARVSQPEYIMARSVFSSLAGVVVTIAVVILVVKWAFLRLPLDYGVVHMLTVFIECAFILVGWIVVSHRWLTAVIYFPRKVEFLHYSEDFWTRSIVELKDELDAQLTCRLYKEKIVKQRKAAQRVILHLITAVRLHSILLPMRFWLQKLMVWLSKVCWVLSQKLMGMIRSFIIKTQNRLYGSYSRRDDPQLQKYKTTLDFIRMPGEMAENLWVANEMAFRKAQGKMQQGIEKGQSDSAKLIKLMKEHKPASSPNSYFRGIRQMSWKRKGVSLMYCMIHFYEDDINFDGINGATRDNIINTGITNDVLEAYKKASDIDDAMDACSDAWDLLDFVDSSDNVTADKEFDNLRNMWQKHFKKLEEIRLAITRVQGNIENGENWHGSLESWQGSENWMSLTLQCNLYKKLYKRFQFENNADQDNGEQYPIKKLQSIFAYVIHDCLEKFKTDVIDKCNKWAEEGNENEIYDAAFIAGKAKGLRTAVDEATEQANGLSDMDANDEAIEKGKGLLDETAEAQEMDKYQEWEGRRVQIQITEDED